jgi:carbohydrate diacid regulator
MSNRLFQGIIHQMKDAVGRVVGVVDESGTIVSCTELAKIGDVITSGITEAFSTNNPVTVNGYTYRAFGSAMQPEYAVFVEGNDTLAEKYTSILSVSLSSIKQYYDEKYDRSNFVKNVMLDNILPGDIYLKARELHFNNETLRVVFLLRLGESCEASVFEMIQSLFPDKNKDFVININENDIAIIKDISSGAEIKDLEKLARSVIDSLDAEVSNHAVVGIGTQVKGVKELARSFKEAQVALEVGKVFDTEKVIVSYENLGIARLIYQLPTTLCEMFLREVFKRGSIESLDHETLFTIQKFFENNLNVSETSRKLFVHRNTLVYRLEKIRKLTGLDLREFDDAIVFKVALMVKKYLDSSPIKY